MGFDFDPTLQNVYVQEQRFPATPGMVSFVNAAAAKGFAIFGLTGRNDDQRAATLANLTKVGYTSFAAAQFFTKWTGKPGSTQPSYITCATTSCTTVEYKAGTRKHIETDLTATPAARSTTSCSTSVTSGPTCRAGTPTRRSSCRTRRTTCPARTCPA